MMRLFSIVALMSLVGCASSPAPQPAALPGFVVDALQTPNARKAKIYIGSNGSIDKTVAYVDRAGIPDWVHAMADEQLGAGEDDEYEIEQYADGTQTYEITRVIDGLKAELSVTTDRKVRYTERALADDAVPEPIKAAIADMQGLQVTRVELKKGPDLHQFEVVAMRGESEMRIALDPNGKVLSQARRLPAVIQLDER